MKIKKLIAFSIKNKNRIGKGLLLSILLFSSYRCAINPPVRDGELVRSNSRFIKGHYTKVVDVSKLFSEIIGLSIFGGTVYWFLIRKEKRTNRN